MPRREPRAGVFRARRWLPVGAGATAMLFAAACAVPGVVPGAADAAPVLISAQEASRLAREADRYPLFREEVERARAEIEAAMAAPLAVPLPKDPGGGYTHEQHKRNYKIIRNAGLLYRITGEKRYADYLAQMLLAYAELYPQLGRHPAARGKKSGRLFWQSLNDTVWLVNAIEGYDAARAALREDDRRRIEADVFRRMAQFLTEGARDEFDLIHNHATWATAAVGMTGYVLRDPALVRMALLGTDGSGTYGFLRQMDLLFSPDGYYVEGPYYQRYAMLPFVVFARAIEANEPERKIFEHRDGLLLKAIHTAIQLTYGGYFFPLNDAIKDKGLWTEELYHSVAIAYERTRDDRLLSIAALQNRTVLSPGGLAVAAALDDGRAKPFAFSSLCLSDGAHGDRGQLAVLRSGEGPGHLALVAKNTAQGMGHGHFDKLSWLLYDNGAEVITDYGGARFLNIEAKDGGKYLPENKSWAKQTVAHNTLVVDEHSHFDADDDVGERFAPTPLACKPAGDTQLVAARMENAYPGFRFARTLAVLTHPTLEHPLSVDLLRARGPRPAQLDLPLHYQGHIMAVGFPVQRKLTARPVLGTMNGYQHLWVDATGKAKGPAQLTWLLKDRFYTYHFVPPPGATLILAESGANDPNFNLRREPVLIQRLRGARETTFVGVLEPHGRYDGAAETTQGEPSQIAKLERIAGADGDLILITTTRNAQIALAVAHDAQPGKRHRISAHGRDYEWQGYFARFDAQ